MKQIKIFMMRIMHPRMAWIMLLTTVSGAALIFTFATGKDTTLLAYISYVLSAYAMTVVIINFKTMREKAKDSVRRNRAWNSLNSFLLGHAYSRRYMVDISYRVKISLLFSLILNLLYAALKLISGIYYASFWYGADAIYYIILCVARIMLTRYMQKRSENDLENEYRIYRAIGILLFALNAALTGVVYQVVNQNMGYEYPGLLIYVVATFAFINITAAVYSTIKFRKLNSPVLSAVKVINLAKAMVAMFALQSAMFASFGEDNEIIEPVMNSIFGGCLCIAVFIMAVYMIVRANKNLAKIGHKENSFND